MVQVTILLQTDNKITTASFDTRLASSMPAMEAQNTNRRCQAKHN